MKIQWLINANSNESRATDKLVEFANKNFIVLSTSLEEYERKEIKVSRILWAFFYRFCLLVTSLRYFMSSVFNNKTMITIMCDANYLLGNQRVFSMIFSLACFVILFIALVLQINEMNYKWYLLTFLYQWKHHQVGYSRQRE